MSSTDLISTFSHYLVHGGTTINKLGHGVSYSVLQETLTEVAYKKTDDLDADHLVLPENCSKETFTILVEDNVDRLEETLSGNYFYN